MTATWLWHAVITADVTQTVYLPKEAENVFFFSFFLLKDQLHGITSDLAVLLILGNPLTPWVSPSSSMLYYDNILHKHAATSTSTSTILKHNAVWSSSSQQHNHTLVPSAPSVFLSNFSVGSCWDSCFWVSGGVPHFDIQGTQTQWLIVTSCILHWPIFTCMIWVLICARQNITNMQTDPDRLQQSKKPDRLVQSRQISRTSKILYRVLRVTSVIKWPSYGGSVPNILMLFLYAALVSLCSKQSIHRKEQ